MEIVKTSRKCWNDPRNSKSYETHRLAGKFRVREEQRCQSGSSRTKRTNGLHRAGLRPKNASQRTGHLEWVEHRTLETNNHFLSGTFLPRHCRRNIPARAIRKHVPGNTQGAPKRQFLLLLRYLASRNPAKTPHQAEPKRIRRERTVIVVQRKRSPTLY